MIARANQSTVRPSETIGALRGGSRGGHGGQKQARSQKILLGSAFEEKVDLLIVQYSPGAVAEFIIVWCMFIAHIHEGLY